ncbi:UDP-N-acetylmuramoyl-tripeptide--D-alanyl-D-alanine ligase [Nocardioides korecus]
MIPLTLGEIARAVGGRVVDAGAAGDATVVRGPAFLDTRSPEPEGLFVAFVGERADGHDHAAAAVASGAAAVLGSRATGQPGVVVDDVRAALQELARVVLDRRRRLEGPDGRPAPLTVIALTGSQGKTSAKDMLAHVLADHAPTVATAGSFNNELGLPLTVLRAGAETRYLVLEMGARGIGHLTELCAIARPDVSLVLNVGRAHIGEFGSQEAIAQAKGEIVEALDDGTGVAVLNADDARVSAMEGRTDAPVVLFGEAAGADVRLSGVVLDDLGRPSFDLTALGRTEHVDLRLLGAHQALNAAAVTGVARAVGLPLDRVAASLRSLERLSRWRMEVHERADGLVVVNDAYNANPDSMRSALETLARMGRERRTVAVLGEMRELGGTASDEHRALGLLAADLGIDEVVVVGEGARGVHEALAGRDAGVDGATRSRLVPGVDEAVSWLSENVAGPDVVLVKASRSGRLEQVADRLLADAGSATRPGGEEDAG